MSKATALPTKLGGSKKKIAVQQNQINMGIKILYSIARHGELTPGFILFPGLFEIIAQ